MWFKYRIKEQGLFDTPLCQLIANSKLIPFMDAVNDSGVSNKEETLLLCLLDIVHARVLETLATFNNFHRVVLCRSIATITDLLDLFWNKFVVRTKQDGTRNVYTRIQHLSSSESRKDETNDKSLYVYRLNETWFYCYRLINHTRDLTGWGTNDPDSRLQTALNTIGLNLI